jgi:hypothetical protein
MFLDRSAMKVRLIEAIFRVGLTLINLARF